ncbi:MAG: topoisomerase DNA-binding C4 zinc finger domain-containing protein [Lachnospiraceae bacterium]|nr:topoisomerase DNA-binding C4 zinc finger domain-containing protein [Lachnospiraceae bacterium]
MESEFPTYGGRGRVNLGTCYDCQGKHPPVIEDNSTDVKKWDASQCPVCGGKLRRINGRYGAFMGCRNYPKCKYAHSIK